MDARKVAAQFAAHTWYEEIRGGKQSPQETSRFVKENWSDFLPIAHEGLGRFLMQIIPQRSPKRRKSSLGLSKLAAVG